MYSVAGVSLRKAGARPSSRSDDRNRRSPLISAVEMCEALWDDACAAAPADRISSSGRHRADGRVMARNLTGGYLARDAHDGTMSVATRQTLSERPGGSMTEESPEEAPAPEEQPGAMIGVLIVVLVALVAYFIVHVVRGGG